MPNRACKSNPAMVMAEIINLGILNREEVAAHIQPYLHTIKHPWFEELPGRMSDLYDERAGVRKPQDNKEQSTAL